MKLKDIIKRITRVVLPLALLGAGAYAGVVLLTHRNGEIHSGDPGFDGIASYKKIEGMLVDANGTKWVTELPKNKKFKSGEYKFIPQIEKYSYSKNGPYFDMVRVYKIKNLKNGEHRFKEVLHQRILVDDPNDHTLYYNRDLWPRFRSMLGIKKHMKNLVSWASESPKFGKGTFQEFNIYPKDTIFKNEFVKYTSVQHDQEIICPKYFTVPKSYNITNKTDTLYYNKRKIRVFPLGESEPIRINEIADVMTSDQHKQS